MFTRFIAETSATTAHLTQADHCFTVITVIPVTAVTTQVTLPQVFDNVLDRYDTVFCINVYVFDRIVLKCC
jgi:hypothetical protein